MSLVADTHNGHLQLRQRAIHIEDGAPLRILDHHEHLTVSVLEFQPVYWRERRKGARRVWVYTERPVLRIAAFGECR